MRFNTYLLLLAMLVVVAGCQSTESKRKKQVAVLRVHVEVFPDKSGFNEAVSIVRASPITVNVSKSPFLTEAEVAGAKIVEDHDGFALAIQFNQRGTWILEQYSASNPGKRFAIYSQFGKNQEQGRWLAAPIIARRIADGVLTFTPDADREEAAQIELGLNNVARKTQPRAEKKDDKERRVGFSSP